MGRGETPTVADVVVICGGVAGSGMAGDLAGGKLTTFGLMAEKTANAFCAKLGVERPCATAQAELSPAKAASGG